MKSESTFFTMLDLAERVPDGEIKGDNHHRVKRLVHPAEVETSEDLCLLMSPAALNFLSAEGAKHACAIVDRCLAEDANLREALGGLSSYLVVDRPRYALAKLSPLFRRQPEPPRGIHPTASIEDGAIIGENISVGPNAWIAAGAQIGDGTTIMANVSICENAVIGEDCFFFPGTYVGHGVEIGNRVIIHANAVLGGDGFAFDSASIHRSEDARKIRSISDNRAQALDRIESLGNLRIADDVEIGACTTIDRSTLGATTVGRGTKIDNLVQIGHGNQIGEDVLLCAQVGLAGSSTIGDGAVLAGKVGVADHCHIGENSVVMAKSGVVKDIPPGEIYYGMPARPVRETLRQYSLIARLDEMSKRLARLESQLEKTV
ncbi:MAG: UDP-3-O-(3-hydroxymyristoyl)glucosamine N-acyltransferase [Verrucomicrobiales bacterium]